MPKLPLFAVSLALAACAPGLSRPPSHSPLVEVRLNSDVYPAPGSSPSATIIFVACQDGRAIRASTMQRDEDQFISGHLSPASLDALKERISVANFKELTRECELRAVDVGTASISAWPLGERKFARCTWPAIGKQLEFFSSTLASSELQDSAVVGQPPSGSEFCK